MKPSGKGGSKPRAPVVHAFDHAHWDTARRRSGDRIETSGLVDKVVRRIGQDVISGLFKPGDTLPNESALCERLGVSRSVLREAVRVLVSKGLLLRKSRLGTRVCPTDAWSLLDSDVLGWLSAIDPPDRFVRELFGLRRAVEPAIAALAAQSMSAVDLAALEACHRDMIAAGDDADRFFEPDFCFHRIMRSVENSLVQALGRIMMQALEINLRLSLGAPLGQQKSVPQHGAVLEAIRRRDPEGAREATTRLINDAEGDVWHALALERRDRARPDRRMSRRSAMEMQDLSPEGSPLWK